MRVASSSVNAAWRTQVGPAYSAEDVAALLGRSLGQVLADPDLVAVRQPDGAPVFPVFQFTGRRQVPGLGRLVRALRPGFDGASIAAWLTTPRADLQGATPQHALLEDAEFVVLLAHRAAAAAS